MPRSGDSLVRTGAVVGVDGTASSEDALALARALEPWSGEAHPVTVVDEPVADGLRRAAEERGARVIVVGSTHRGPLGRIYPGSTAQRLLHEATTPVAVAPRGYAHAADPRLFVIGVAFDASSSSRAALAVAEELCLAGADALRVYAVAGNPDPVEPMTAQRAETLDVALHEAVAGLDPDARALPVLLHGAPVDQLTARSHEVDLLVTGSAGGSPLDALLRGSVSTALMDSLACPLLAVRARAG